MWNNHYRPCTGAGTVLIININYLSLIHQYIKIQIPLLSLFIFSPRSQPDIWTYSCTASASGPSSFSASSLSPRSRTDPTDAPVKYIWKTIIFPLETLICKSWNLSDLTIPEIPDEFEESDESSSSAHSCTAVNQHGSFRHLDQISLGLVLQVQQHLRVSRHLKVGPTFAVELGDEFHFTCIS